MEGFQVGGLSPVYFGVIVVVGDILDWGPFGLGTGDR